jgi:putative ABC transport system permease protein
MRSLWAAGFLLRRLRTEVGVVALLVALVALTSFLFAGAPRLFNLIADAALVDQLRSAAVVDRDLELSSTAISPVAPSDPDPLAAVDDLSGEYLAAFPDSIARLIGERRFSITSPRFWLPVPPRYPTYLSLRYQDGLDGAIRLVAGRLPASNGEPLPVATLEFDVEPPPLPATPPRIEIAVSEATAAEIGVDIGTTLAVRLDGTSPTVRGFVLRLIEAEFRVVGIFAVDDPEAEIWYENRALQRPEIGGSDENPIAYATALVAPEAYADLAASRLPFQFAWRFFLTPERADVGQLDRLVPDLRRIQAVNADATFGSYLPGTLVLRTGLVGVIERYLAARSAAEAVLTVAAIGPFALAVGAIAMLAVLLVIRRRASLELARGRGASGLLVLAAQLWEGVLLAGGASLVGLLLAVQLVPGRGSSLSQWLAIATAAAAALAMVAATWPVVRRRLGPAGREDAAVLPASPRRLVLELTGVGLAVAGVLLLQQRGLVIGDRQFGEPVRLDPFLAAVPVLAGLAMGIVAMRLYPIPVRAFSWLAARRRDLVPVLGLRNVGRHGAAANLPLLVLMLTAAFGAFASVVLSSIDHGQADAAWRQVGADYRIELGPSGEGRAIDPTQVEAVQAVAGAYLDQSTTFSDTPSQRSQVVLDAIDADAYQRVVDGSSIAFTWPRGFTDAPTPAGAAGTPEAPIPAIVSERLPSGSGPLARGDPFEVDVGIHTLSFVVVGRQASFPGVRPNAAFVIVSLDLLQEVQPEGPLSPNVLFVRAAGDAGPGLARITEGSASTIVSRYERHEELRSAPLVAMVIGGFRIALLVAVAYAALAIVGALTLTASRRSQDLAFLRTLGLSARQALGLTVLEQGPPVVLALIPGVALGIWIAVLLATGLGLSAFVGDEEAIAISVSWGEIALVGGSLVMMVTIAGAASTWLARRARAVDALRLGGD